MAENMELYIHIPFCVKKCRYCDFLSFDNAYRTLSEKYFHKLNEELKFYGEQSGNSEIRSVFFGGGTPGMVSANEILEVMETVKTFYRLSPECEITLETNPGVADYEKLKAFRNMGINRLSIGVQSFDDSVLKNMGRIHSSEDAEKAFVMAREAGYENINTDLMFGYPSQTVDSFIDTLKKAIELSPEHISAYSLIVEEGTKICRDIENGLVPEPEDDVDREMYNAAFKMLTEAGYERYEISNFSKTGRESVHNLGYWTGVPYIGVGLGAASFVEGVRYKNTCDLSRYINSSVYNLRDESETDILSVKGQMDEFMMLGFRLQNGPSYKLFMEKFGVDYKKEYKETLDKLYCKGLITEIGNNFCLTDKGFDFGNEVFGEFV
ncbi:MAG: radical SAM family heme chaperone HemW [Ruminococcaceae bacterium]|nr:radical SAM family heme chaperone HemW [Oscillospiraceae bacterium]